MEEVIVELFYVNIEQLFEQIIPKLNFRLDFIQCRNFRLLDVHVIYLITIYLILNNHVLMLNKQDQV